MKITFAAVSNRFPRPQPIPLIIHLPKSENGWMLQTLHCHTTEEWIEGVRKLLLSIGICDVDYAPIATNPKNNIQQGFHFYFKNHLECLQFQALVLSDKKGKFTKEFSSGTESEAYKQAANVRKFLLANEIPFELIWTDNEKFTVTTTRKHHNIALSIQEAKGTFQKAPNEMSQRSRVPTLLLRNEKA